MKLKISRKENRFYPDFKRVIVRYLYYGDDRAKYLIDKVINMLEEEAADALTQTLRDFAMRHRNISKTFFKHYHRVKFLFRDLGLSAEEVSDTKKLLIGSYFSMEYSIESAAFFNPSIVQAPDQSGLVEGEKRVIVSFRAVGEGHISSIVFRNGIIHKDNTLTFNGAGNRIEEADIVKDHIYSKKTFIKKMKEMDIHLPTADLVKQKLKENFTYRDLKHATYEVKEALQLNLENQTALNQIEWIADSHYEMQFSLDTDISERVIFPISETESQGIEDARFVRFIDEMGEVTYYATYTAFNGFTILPKLLETKDFYHFKVKPLYGEGAQNKNLALFPRKIDGKYAMISRIDGKNSYIMFSDSINVWENAIKLQEPLSHWEFIQVGNCGSPVEIKEGWLLITHGVGPMRKYCLGASLFDLDDPTKEIGRLREPLLEPNPEEREGYVPNVVYSCGALVHNDELIVPYAMSDYASSFFSVPIEDLVNKILNR